MAKNVWDEPIGKDVPWDGNEDTDGLPVRGRRVEEFIKNSLNKKIGVLYYDTTNNRYLAFADSEDRDRYIDDPTQINLVLGTFDAPFNYSAEINLATPIYNAVFVGTSGHYVDFTFDIKNKQGASTGESVIVKYTFMRGSTKHESTEIKSAGSNVHFNIDKYLAEGTNTIIVSVTGQNTLASTSVSITYEVVNLQLNDTLVISKVYDLSNGSASLDIPYTISGYGTKIIEWFIDGNQTTYIKSEDEVVETNASRTKHITLSNLNQGRHSLQFRAYTTVNGEKFYTDTIYRDIIVYTGVNSDVIIGIATTIPSEYGILLSGEQVKLYGMIQYVPYVLRFATYSPSNASNTKVSVFVDGEEKSTINANNGSVNTVVITPTISGDKTLIIKAGDVQYQLLSVVSPTTMNIYEITDGLTLNFSALGKTNESSDRDSWSYGSYTGVLSGFTWNNASGWVNNRLELSSGASFQINYAPLANSPTLYGKTVEIEWATKNVKNDNAIICDLRNNEGVGIVIYATKVSMISADGVTIETEYKSGENVRVAFVINRSTGSANQRMSFIYANGILSRADKWALTDSYTSNTMIKFEATNDAEISLKSIRIYDNALSPDNILNNYILYRDTIDDMMEVYDRNNVYEDGRDIFSPTKMASRLPIMVITGDIPTLENTSDKDTQIVVDIEYTNLQDPTRSFKMAGAAMRPQGTSSMGYPKKNFRIYTQKLDSTIVYDYNGNVVPDKLYAFREGAQPVNCWCLKADYAESSGTHNTGIARLWNKALYDARVTVNLGKDNPHNVDNATVLRTMAQTVAAREGYPYDVRTTIDGFPILLFYRPSENDDVIFIGKYNFNNDKSTESVFGFEGIPNFDNTHMQCWEVLNNGNPLALFTTVENFDTIWSEAFESRYPDTKSPDISGLKAFAQWMSTVNQSDFVSEKWEHMDVYKMAAYWCYLMRHAAADQFVKNAMFTSEDGTHFYYILYDNDTINGLINTGHLSIKPTDTRQTVDAMGVPVFAGKDSRLWNMIEKDAEFMQIVTAVDDALYSAGISYDNTIRIFDEEQANKWVERVYNQDAAYKYISPYVDRGIDNLFMLQGKRDLHRRWWLAKRYAIYDAKYVSGQYKSLSIELKCINDTPSGQRFTITAGYPIEYGYGINDVPRTVGVPLEVGDAHTFATSEVVNLGDPIRIYGAPHIAELDLSLMSDRLAVVTVANVYNEAQGTKLTKLIIGNAQANNLQVAEISGLRQAKMLEYLDIQGMKSIVSLDLSEQIYFKTLKAYNTNLSSITFARGALVENVELPTTMRVLAFEQLPILDSANILMESVANVQNITVSNCPNISNDFDFIYNWYTTKTSPNQNCSLEMDNISWSIHDADNFIDILSLKSNGNLSLKGVVSIANVTLTQLDEIREILGDTAFDPNADFYVEVPTILQIISPSNSILEGSSVQLTATIYPIISGTYQWGVSGRDGVTISNEGLLVIEETGDETSNITVNVRFTSNDGEIVVASKTIEVQQRVYPTGITISGEDDPRISPTYTWESANTGVNGDVITKWTLTGGATSYWEVVNSTSKTCTLRKTAAMPSSTTGTLSVIVKRASNDSVIASLSKNISINVVFPSDATIRGEADPTKGNKTYTWNTTTVGVNGEYTAEWSLSGDVTSIVEIAEQNNTSCTMRQLSPVNDIVSGILTLTLKKVADATIILTVTKSLEVMMEGVIITKTSNPGIQASLYKAGLVANENYSLQSEVEIITAEQLQPGSSQSTSIFYAERKNITSFNEFRYFVGVKSIPRYLFAYSNLSSIVLPEGVTGVEDYAFYECESLEEITIPDSFISFGNGAFGYCEKLSKINVKETYLDIYLRDAEVPINSSFGSTSTTTHWRFYINGEPLSNIVIPDYITALNGPLFEHYEADSVDLGDRALVLDGYVFRSALIKRIIGGSATTTDLYAWDGCEGIESIDMNCDILFLTCSGDNERRYTIFYNYDPYTTNEREVTFEATSGAWFGDKTQSKTLSLTQTGVVQDLTNDLRIGYFTLTINSNKPDAEFKVDYTDISSGEESSMTLTAGTHAIPAKLDTYVTINGLTEYDGFTTPSNGFYMSASKTVTCNYDEIVNIYIQHVDGTLYSTNEWSSAGYANDQANGVAVVAGSGQFVVAAKPLPSMVAWGGYGSFTTITATTDLSVAMTDFDGKGHTDILLAGYPDKTYAVNLCAGYTFPNGNKGYLGAAGEWALIGSNRGVINEALRLIGGTVISSYKWTSTQHKIGYAWTSTTNSALLSYDSKTNKRYVRPLTTLR